MRTLSRCLVPFVAALVVATPVAAAAAAPGGETPQAVVARLEKAAETKDMVEMLSCLTPSARREMAMVLVAGAGMMVAFMGMGSAMGADMAEGMAEGVSGEELPAGEKAKLEEQKRQAEAKAAELMTQYEGILDRHGITAMMEDDKPLPEDPAARRAELDRMFADTDEIALVSDLMAMMNQLGMSKDEGPSSPVALPGEVTDYQIDGDKATAKAGAETLQFVRVDGRWYLEPDAGPGMEAPPPEG